MQGKEPQFPHWCFGAQFQFHSDARESVAGRRAFGCVSRFNSILMQGKDFT